MKNRIVTIGLVCIMLLGIGLLLYPFVSNRLHELRQDKVIVDSAEAIEEMETAKISQMWQEAQAYNEGLKTSVILTDPMEALMVNPALEEYYSIINLNEQGVMGYLEIPRLELFDVIYHGTTEDVLSKGIGHLALSSFPIGGESNHAVLSAHTGLPEAELFTNLPQMQEGDIFYIHILDEVLAYQVDQIKIVEPSDTGALQIVEGEDYVTLVTCTPYGLNTHRYLVRGTRVDYTAEIEESGKNQKAEGIEKEQWSEKYLSSLIKGAVIGVLIICIMVGVIVYSDRAAQKRRRKRKQRRDNQ